jgi:hypothetical protein
MKQGTGHSTDSGRKIEPRAHAVSVPYVAEMGQQYVRTTSLKMYEGRGYEAPKNSSTCHPCGSQGRH